MNRVRVEAERNIRNVMGRMCRKKWMVDKYKFQRYGIFIDSSGWESKMCRLIFQNEGAKLMNAYVLLAKGGLVHRVDYTMYWVFGAVVLIAIFYIIVAFLAFREEDKNRAVREKQREKEQNGEKKKRKKGATQPPMQSSRKGFWMTCGMWLQTLMLNQVAMQPHGLGSDLESQKATLREWNFISALVEENLQHLNPLVRFQLSRAFCFGLSCPEFEKVRDEDHACRKVLEAVLMWHMQASQGTGPFHELASDQP